MTPRIVMFAFAGLIGAAAASTAATPYVDLEKRLTPEQRHATGLDTLTPAQLELLNRLLREERAAAAAPPAGAAQPAASASSSDGENAVPAGQPRDGGPSLIGFNDQPIKSRLKGSIAGWAPDTVFELENGQKWKVLKGSAKLRQPLNRPPIEVIPGVMGRWFLQFTEDMPKARVYRID